VWQCEYHACFIGRFCVMLAKFVYLPWIGNYQKTGEVVFIGFDAFLQHFHSIPFCRSF